jgi:hypothetical protein
MGQRYLSSSPTTIGVNPGATNIISTVTSALNKSQGASSAPKMSLKEKMKLFWKSLYTDYKDVLVETVAESKKKRGKTTFYFSSLGAFFFCLFNNPSEQNYWDQVTKLDTEVSFIHKDIRNSYSQKYLHNIRQMQIKGVLRHQSLGVFSVMWNDKENEETGVFYTNCQYIKPRWTEIVRDRIVDVGFVGQWWLLEKNMRDFDINPSEWGEDSASGYFSSFPPVVKALFPKS